MRPQRNTTWIEKVFPDIPLYKGKVKKKNTWLLPSVVHLPLITMFLVKLLVLSSCTSSRSSTLRSRDGYRYLFDGNTLDGWVYDPLYWRVESGILVGEVTPSTLLKRNCFIIKKDLLTRDFDLRVEYRISSRGNSGIKYRSEVVDSLPFALRGYQADLDRQNRYFNLKILIDFL
jgi:hypothetical protein